MPLHRKLVSANASGSFGSGKTSFELSAADSSPALPVSTKTYTRTLIRDVCYDYFQTTDSPGRFNTMPAVSGIGERLVAAPCVPAAIQIANLAGDVRRLFKEALGSVLVEAGTPHIDLIEHFQHDAIGSRLPSGDTVRLLHTTSVTRLAGS